MAAEERADDNAEIAVKLFEKALAKFEEEDETYEKKDGKEYGEFVLTWAHCMREFGEYYPLKYVGPASRGITKSLTLNAGAKATRVRDLTAGSTCSARAQSLPAWWTARACRRASRPRRASASAAPSSRWCVRRHDMEAVDWDRAHRNRRRWRWWVGNCQALMEHEDLVAAHHADAPADADEQPVAPSTEEMELYEQGVVHYEQVRHHPAPPNVYPSAWLTPDRCLPHDSPSRRRFH